MCIAYERKHYDKVFAYLNSIERLNILVEDFKNDPDYDFYREKINILLENAEKKFERKNIEKIMKEHCYKNDLSFNDIDDYITKTDIVGWYKHEYEKMEYKFFAVKHGHYDKILAYLNSVDRLYLLCEKIKNDPDYNACKAKVSILKKIVNESFDRNYIENKIKEKFLENNKINLVITGGNDYNDNDYKDKYLKYKNKYLEKK